MPQHRNGIHRRQMLIKLSRVADLKVLRTSPGETTWIRLHSVSNPTMTGGSWRDHDRVIIKAVIVGATMTVTILRITFSTKSDTVAMIIRRHMHRNESVQGPLSYITWKNIVKLNHFDTAI